MFEVREIGSLEEQMKCKECVYSFNGVVDIECDNHLISRLGRPMTELEERDALLQKLEKILTETANALKGEPDELSMHSWHDLAEVAAKIVKERDMTRIQRDALQSHVEDLTEKLYSCEKKLREIS